MRILIVAALAVLLALPSAIVSTQGRPNAQPDAGQPALVITNESARPAVPFGPFDGHPMKLFDFNGDGALEIVAQNDNRHVYVFDAQHGTLLAEVATTYPSSWPGGGNAGDHKTGPEAANLAGGQESHLVLYNAAAVVTVLRFDAQQSTGSHFEFTKVWERRLTDCFAAPTVSNDSRPVLADVDGDGKLDILLQTEESGVFAFKATGVLLWKKCIPGGNADPGVGDLDADGRLEVVWVSDSGVVTTVDGRTGATRWTFALASHGLGVGSIPVGPAIAQVDGVGPLDIVFGARDSHDANDFSRNHAALFVVSGDGKLVWMRQDPDGAPLTYTHPIVIDEDGDGRADIFWADWNNIGHKPPWDEADAWKRTGPAHIYRYNATGDLVWRQSLDTIDHDMDIAIADMDGDGNQDVVAVGPNNGTEGVWNLDVDTGAMKNFVSTAPWFVTRGPAVDDLWGDGTTQWVVPVQSTRAPGAEGAILVFDTGVPFNAQWPHLPYPLTPPPRPPVTLWQAESFTSKSTGAPAAAGDASAGAYWNLWANGFIETSLTSDGVSPFSVMARGTPARGTWPHMAIAVDGQPVVNFTVASANFTQYALPTPSAGSHLVRISFTNDLRTTQEDRNLHLDALQLNGEVEQAAPAPTADFSATIDAVRGNGWWVQANVITRGENAAAVEVQIDGVWQPLAKQTWGGWAASYPMVQGTIVQLRATSPSGATDLSKCYRWIPDGNKDAANVTCSGTSSSSSAPVFDATFTGVKGNAWWIQANVAANEGLSGVEARINCSTHWKPLVRHSWGGWAASFNVPSGATIDFRATGNSGAVDGSSGYLWPQATKTRAC